MPHEGYADPLMNDGPGLHSNGPHGRWWRAEVAAQRGGVFFFADPSLLSPLHVFLRCVFFSPLLYAVKSLATLKGPNMARGGVNSLFKNLQIN